MTTPAEHPLVHDYLARFDAVAVDLDPTRRRRLREEIEEHLNESITPDMPESDADVVLRLLGSPEEIVGAEATAPREPADALTTRTRIVAGALLIAAAVVGFVIPVSGVFIPRLMFTVAVIWLAAGPGSITARRPLGSGALVGLAILGAADLVADPILYRLAGAGALWSHAGDPAVTEVVVRLDLALQVGQLILATVGCVQIARAGVVPRAWRWIPLWTMVTIVAATVVEWAVGYSWPTTELIVSTVGSPSGVIRAIGTVLLGVLAIVFATRDAAQDRPVMP